MREALQELMQLIDDQVLVRNISDDKDVMKFFKQGLRIARVLKMAQIALEESK
jgi:hypothetical protein